MEVQKMIKNFLRKYGYYMVAIALIFAVGITAGTSGKKTPVNQIVEPAGQTNTSPVEMLCPLTSAEVIKWYSDTDLFYNSTLKQWESHKAVDLASSESNDVYAVLDGKVTDCSYSYGDGYCVTISHEDGLSTVYCSLTNTDNVKEGDSVKRGQKIGETSTSASNESLEGSHLHFAIKLNGKPVDPANYITFDNK